MCKALCETIKYYKICQRALKLYFQLWFSRAGHNFIFSQLTQHKINNQNKEKSSNI